MTEHINGASNIFVPPTLSDLEREVMERLPLKLAMRSLLKQLNDELEERLLKAIEAYLGAKLTDPEILRGRLAHVEPAGDAEVGLTYMMDGTPILWVGPTAITREGDHVQARRDIQQLVPDRDDD
jgi:hypothetical protein